MIYTLTLNPSIDYIVEVANYQEGKTNRTIREEKYPGGKGINVSRILKELDTENTALGYVGGFTGEFIEETLRSLDIQTDFIRVEEDSRINIKLKTALETEINASGPNIDDREIELLKEKINVGTEEDIFVLSGSKQASLPDNFYEELIQRIEKQGARFVLDTSSHELLHVLNCRPLLIKPNREELEAFFDMQMNKPEDVIPYGQELVRMGAEYVIVSLGGEGAYFFTADCVYVADAPKGQLVNSTGAGDSMVAGFLASFIKDSDPVKAFAWSVAAGSATAFAKDLAKKEEILHLVDHVVVEKMARKD